MRLVIASMLAVVAGCSEPSLVAGGPAPAHLPTAQTSVQLAEPSATANVPPSCAACKEAHDTPESTTRVDVGARGIELGDTRAAHTIVVFTDLECPFCADLHERVRTFIAEHPRDYRVVLRHRPLPFHKHASGLARAAIVADRLGKGEAFVTAAFAAAKADPTTAFDVAARAVGLDPASLKRDAESADVAETLAADEAEGDRLAIRGTPTSFVDGRILVGARRDFAEQVFARQR